MAVRLDTASSRPTTRQIQSRSRAIYTSNAPNNRMYKDRKFISTIQSHMGTIREEMVNLTKNTLDSKSSAFNRAQARRDAENLAKTFSDCQETLTTYNVALEVQASQEKIDKLAYDTNLFKQKNKTYLNELEVIVNNKARKEETKQSLKASISKEDAIVQGVIDNLSDADKAAYSRAVKENEQVTYKIKLSQKDINKYKDTIKHYQNVLGHNSLKERQVILLDNLEKTRNQKNILTKQVKETLTPAQEREELVQQVKNDKADTEALTKMKQSLEQELQLKSEKLSELQEELNEKNTVRLKKHKELRDRDEYMSNFIANFDEKSTELGEKMIDTQKKIITALSHTTNSVAYLNFEELDNMQSNLNQSSFESLSNQFEFLSLRLNGLISFKEKYQDEITLLKEKRNSLQSEMINIQNPTKARNQLLSQIELANDKCQNLRYTLTTTSSAVAEAERKKLEINSQLTDNSMYREIYDIELKIESIEKENGEIRDELNVVMLSDQLTQKLKKIQELTVERNNKLIKAMKNKELKPMDTSYSGYV